MSSNLQLLAVDPGETIGVVHLDLTEGNVTLRGSHQQALSFHDAVRSFKAILLIFPINVLVIEDYRIYASHAGHHIGAHLYTPELIGAIAALSVLHNVPLVRLPASKKARWPLARLKNRFPQYTKVPTPHALDALKLGLAYLETQGARFNKEEVGE